MAVSVDWGSFLRGSLKQELHYLGSILRPPMFGNSHMEVCPACIVGTCTARQFGIVLVSYTHLDLQSAQDHGPTFPNRESIASMGPSFSGLLEVHTLKTTTEPGWPPSQPKRLSVLFWRIDGYFGSLKGPEGFL